MFGWRLELTHRVRKVGYVVCSSAMLLVLYSNAANAADTGSVEDRLSTTEKRLDSLDGKIDQLIELMRAQAQQNATAPVAVSSGSAANARVVTSDARLKPGMNLDVYSTPYSDTFPEAPTGASLGRLIDNNAPLLKYDAYKKDKIIAQFADASDNPFISVQWSGQIQITDSGDHLFALAMSRAQGGNNYDAYMCFESLSIDDQEVSKKTARIRTGGQFSQQASVALNPGIYSVKVWMVCHHHSRGSTDYDRLSASLLMRGPRDATLAPIPKSLLGHL